MTKPADVRSVASMPTLTINIACYNRPSLAAEAIRSVLDQTDRRFLLRVSDNSTSDCVQSMMKERFPNVDYMRRIPSVPVCAHGNLILSECRTPYAMIMHDDDILSSEFVLHMLRFIDSFPDAVCYASNALMIDSHGHQLRSYFYAALGKHTFISDPVKLIARWFSYGGLSVPPIPAYIYAMQKIEGLQFDTDKFGQFSDFGFIHGCSKRQGGLVWLNEPLYRYRVHTEQDSARITFGTSQCLKKYIRLEHPIHYGSSDFKVARALNLLNILRRSQNSARRRRLRRIAARAILATPRSIMNRCFLYVYDALSKLSVKSRQID